MAPTRAVVVAVLAAASFGGWWLGQHAPGASSEAAVVIKVDDGDTIVVRIGSRTDTIRLLGIDTPDRVKDPLWLRQVGGSEGRAIWCSACP